MGTKSSGMGSAVGEVTSGGYSPSLDSYIGLGYVQTDMASPGARLDVDVRGRVVEATVVDLPFYSRRRDLMNPTDRRYSKEHEWVLVESEGHAVVGITQYAQDQLGDVVYVDLPDAGVTVEQFQKLGEIESVKGRIGLVQPSVRRDSGSQQRAGK